MSVFIYPSIHPSIYPPRSLMLPLMQQHKHRRLPPAVVVTAAICALALLHYLLWGAASPSASSSAGAAASDTAESDYDAAAVSGAIAGAMAGWDVASWLAAVSEDIVAPSSSCDAIVVLAGGVDDASGIPHATVLRRLIAAAALVDERGR